MIVCGHVASKTIEDRFNAEEGATQETKLWEAVSQVRTLLQVAAPKTFTVGKKDRNPPHTQIRFRTQRGDRYSFYEDDQKLYMEQNGQKTVLADDLISAFFSFPNRANGAVLIELKGWDQSKTSLGIIEVEAHASIPSSRRGRGIRL